jgi:pyruvate decarboxylase
MSKHITVASTVLDDSTTAAAEIDRVLTAMMIESRPVYIGVPADLSHYPIAAGKLSTPLNTLLPADDAELTKAIIDEIRKLIETATSPVLIIDGCKAIGNHLPQ